MSWTIRKFEYERIARKIDPAVKLTTKDKWPWKVMAAVVQVVTFGGISYRRFLEDYATTIGPIQAYPRKWRKLSTRLLVHEARHTRQFRWMGLFIHPWVGVLPMALLYVFLPLPLGFAWFRWWFEIDAEKTAYRWALANGYTPQQIRERAVWFGSKVCGSNYGWSWPTFLGGISGFEKAAAVVIREVWERGNESR